MEVEIEEDRSEMKIDRGQLSKQKNPPIDVFEHLVGKMERQVGKARKTWVKDT